MNSLFLQDTIVALASGDNGAIGIVRLSGQKSFFILDKIFSQKNNVPINQLEPNKMIRGTIKEKNKLIDEVLIVLYKSPHSYTGEDIVEFFCHGGQYNLNRILNLIISQGARLAQKGEFTKRAFLNGKIDLTKAEAVNELIRANNDFTHTSAVKQLDGSLYRYVLDIRKKFLEIRAYFEAQIDYPEDNLETKNVTQFYEYLKNLKIEFEKHLQRLETARLYQNGLSITIAGKTNVGKSSLLNFLLQSERTIVSDEHGTTRDVVKEQLFLKDVPISIFDTAGLKTNNSHIDKKAITFTYQYIDKADFIIFIVDNSRPWDQFDKELYTYIQNHNKKFVVLINKIDLPKTINHIPFDHSLEISLKENINLDQIEDFLYSHIIPETNDETFFVFSKRYEELFKIFIRNIDKLMQELHNFNVYDMILYDLEDVFKIISQLTGEITTDDILDKVFNDFCVGK